MPILPLVSTVSLLFISAALIVISLIAILNAFTFPRLRTGRPLTQGPAVSVLIPARNEARVIAATLTALLQQTYPDFELLLLDDHSTDGTGDIARRFNDPRLKVISGQPLPAGWLGKNFACHQLASQARGELLIFTDADVRWQSGALAAVVADQQRTGAELLTVWPTQETITPGERLTVPLMALTVNGYLPLIGTHYVPSGIFAAACGQCMVWRRSAYAAVGGHQAVAGKVLEDVTLARLVKRHRLRLRMFDGAGVITCRMYHSWGEVRRGYAKNILAGYGDSIPALLLATVFHWLVFILPPVWLLIGILTGDPNPWALWLTVLGIGVRMLTAAFTRQRVLDGLLMPVSAVLMTIIAFQSIGWRLRPGAAQWKGRTIHPPVTTSPDTQPETPPWTQHSEPPSSSAQA